MEKPPSLLSRILGAPKPLTGHAARDEEVRKILRGRGDTMTTPRHAVFYFYNGNHRELARTAIAAGMTASPTVGGDGVILETMIAVDEAAFEPVNRQMQDWAEQFGCDYDGWECQLVTS